MVDRIYFMLIKEFIQLFRDARMRIIVFLVPVIQTFIFGYALTTDVRNIETAIFDFDNTFSSRKFVDAFSKSGYFDVVDYVYDYRKAQELIDKGNAFVVIHIDHNFEADLLSGKSAPLQAFIDGTDANTANIVSSYIQKIVENFSQSYLNDRIAKMGLSIQKGYGIQLESRAWFNENLESRNYFVPGVVATLITLVTLILTSMAIVREREIGTMEQIIVSPITPLEFILGKTVPFIIIGFIEVGIILCVAVFWFEVPMRGNIFLLLASAGLYLFTTLGIGLFISTISKTQQQAMMSAFLFYFPVVLLSGFIFPISNMPLMIQYLTFLNPLKYFLIIIRGIFLKGIGLEILWPQMIILGMMGVSILWLSSKRFHKRMV